MMDMNGPPYRFPNLSAHSSSSSYPASVQSTNNNSRFGRARLSYALPATYPRPRSSASKPNPGSFSPNEQMEYSLLDGMQDGYKNATYRNSFGTYPEFSYNESNSTIYHSSHESSFSTIPTSSYPAVNENILQTSQYPAHYAGDFSQPSMSNPQSVTRRGARGGFKGSISKYKQNFRTKKTIMNDTKKIHCEVCDIGFTSTVNLDMHLNGARHAKKLKSRGLLHKSSENILNDPNIKQLDSEGKKFQCDICGVLANSTLQLQTHLEGTKHKNKVIQQQGSTSQSVDGQPTASTKTAAMPAKSNGSLIRTAPSDFDEPMPKRPKFSCDTCNVCVNSQIQLEQHLASKKHQAVVEGKPIIKEKKIKPAEDSLTPSTAAPDNDTGDNLEKGKTVIGVKALASSFVQGGVMH